MRLYTIEVNGKEQVAVESTEKGTLYLVKDLGVDVDSMLELIEKHTDEMMKTLCEGAKNPGEAKAYALDSVKVCAPIPTPKHDLLCLGVNYAEHAQEAHHFNESLATYRTETVYFSKRCSHASAPGEGIPMYEEIVDSMDYEVELAVILGKEALNVQPKDALGCVFGYTVINDVSARNLQSRHTQWFRGKSLNGLAPMGPCIVTADEFEDVQNLKLRCYVNGELRQDSNTSLMLQSVAGAIAELSDGMTLVPGDIMATGTPAGVALGMNPPKWLKKGDVVTCEVEGIGSITNPCI